MRNLNYFRKLKMRFNASRLTLAVIAVSALAGSGLQLRAEEKKGEQPSEVSGAKSSLTATNSQAVKPKQNGLKQLEQDLFKPFDRIAPKGSLQDAFAAPAMEPQAPPPPVQGKRAKELLDFRKNWVFETPEEILSGPSSDNIMGRSSTGLNSGKDSDEKSSLSPVERFYDRLYNRKEPSTKGNKRDDVYDSLKPAKLSDRSEIDDDSDLPAGIRETQREIRKRLESKERTETYGEASGNFFSDVFGLSKSRVSRDEIEMQRERMDKYKELVGLPVAPRIENDPLKQYRDMISGSPKASAPIPTMDSMGGRSSQQSIFATQPTSAGAANLSLLPEGAQIHQAPSLAPVLLQPEPPKMLPPPVTFSVPRRAF